MEKTRLVETPGLAWGPEYPIMIELTLDEYVHPDFWGGHSDIFAPDNLLACILFGAFEPTLEAIGEAINMASIDWVDEYIDEATKEFIRRVPVEKILELVDLEELEFFREQYEEFIEDVEDAGELEYVEPPILYGWIHFFHAEDWEPSQRELEEQLNGEGFMFISGDVDWLKYGGKFAKDLYDDGETFHIVEVINNTEYFENPHYRYTLTLSVVCMDDDNLLQALNCCGYSLNNYHQITQAMKVDSLHNYHGGDLITSISGNNIAKMIDWVINASYHYPYIDTYTE